ncbi:hypothetical protein [Streptomyces gilvus]|uniref:hypothetical protein n=1 Tax=Streptomyces gilvus TaxID=2920937 RepID=UPI001F10BDA2|nr:hypothetical protein [Streptomyces sp. CME 23]MCH5674846.1 hypothetical protein [Streptomyces sp. CME 23]
MPINKKSTSEGGDPPRVLRPPTLQTWVALQPAWLVAGMLIPDSRLAIYACVPVSLGTAWLAGRWKLLRTPTWLGLLTACVAYICATYLGVHETATIALAQAGDKLAVTITILSCYAVRECVARAPQWWNAFIESLARKLSTAMRTDPPTAGLDPAE